MPASWSLLLVVVAVSCLIAPAAAFGAGEVPSSSEFKGFVWRHGDITEVLKFLPASFVTAHRFTQLQRKQIYFGNWLRDFSQVIDTTCLESVPEPILRAIVSVLAFMEFGFATDEFDVTRERLGCYTHVEHIDNPRGYQDNAKDIDERLRGPVDPRELEFDPRTGMKNYIANSGQGWRTSADYVREQLEKCISQGRQARSKGGPSSAAAKESFICLGAALHTLEDFSAHSNFTELCLRELGEDDVFPFVGDECRVKTPGMWGKKVPPIVTGTFGMLDIFHSFLGEADDMALLQSKGSLGELEEKLGYGSVAFEHLFELIKKAIEAVETVSTESTSLLKELETISVIFKKASEDKESSSKSELPPVSDKGDASGITNPNFLWQSIEPIFYIHDRMKKWMQEGLEQPEDTQADISTNQLGDYTNQLVFRFLAVMIESSVKELRNAVRAAKDKVDEEAAKSTSAAVYEDGSDASDPSHSDLSKDHFCNVLNQPAGMVATVTTNWTVQQVVRCWDDPSLDAAATIERILRIMHHPAFASARRKTPIQRHMFDTVRGWWEATPDEERERLRGKLTRDSVREREHEDHNLTLRDLVATRGDAVRGYADFPGAWPEVRQPPRRISVSYPFKWAVGALLADANAAIAAVRKSVTDPLGAAGDVASGAGALIGSTARAVIAAPRWVVSKVGGIAGRLWPFG